MKFRYCFLPCFLCAVLPSAAIGQELPRYDVKSYCRDIANFGGTYSAMIEQGCFDLEQSSYNSTKSLWPSLPQSMRDHCDEIATFGGGGSYQILKGCIDLEASAAATPKDFKY